MEKSDDSSLPSENEEEVDDVGDDGRVFAVNWVPNRAGYSARRLGNYPHDYPHLFRGSLSELIAWLSKFADQVIEKRKALGKDSKNFLGDSIGGDDVWILESQKKFTDKAR